MTEHDANSWKYEIVDETCWDTTKGVVRPRLLVLNAWLAEVERMGHIAAASYCDDDWCKLVLMNAGVSEVEATSWTDSEWW